MRKGHDAPRSKSFWNDKFQLVRSIFIRHHVREEERGFIQILSRRNTSQIHATGAFLRGSPHTNGFTWSTCFGKIRRGKATTTHTTGSIGHCCHRGRFERHVAHHHAFAPHAAVTTRTTRHRSSASEHPYIHSESRREVAIRKSDRLQFRVKIPTVVHQILGEVLKGPIRVTYICTKDREPLKPRVRQVSVERSVVHRCDDFGDSLCRFWSLDNQFELLFASRLKLRNKSLPSQFEFFVGPWHIDLPVFDVAPVLMYKQDSQRKSASHLLCNGLFDNELRQLWFCPRALQYLSMVRQFNIGTTTVIPCPPYCLELLSWL